MKYLFALALCYSEFAFSYVISDRFVTFYSDESYATFTITNNSFLSKKYIITLRDWIPGERASPELVLFPPVFTLLPSQRQTVRLFAKNANEVSSDHYYRVAISESNLSDAEVVSLQGTKFQASFPVGYVERLKVADIKMLSFVEGQEYRIENRSQGYVRTSRLLLSDGSDIMFRHHLRPNYGVNVNVGVSLNPVGVVLHSGESVSFTEN